MEGDEYLDFITDLQEKAKSKPKKKRKVAPQLQLGEGSTPGGTPSTEVRPEVVVLSPPPSPPHVQTLSNAVFLEPGELWGKGLTKSLQAAVKPPPDFAPGCRVTPELLESLRRRQEEAMKTASLLESFAGLLISHETTAASNSALHLKVEEVEKEKKTLGDRLKDLEEEASQVAGLKEKVTGYEKRITDLEAELGVAESSAEVARQEKSSLETVVKAKEDRVKDLEAQLLKAKELLRAGVMRAFDNATAQAKVLNPGLVTDGMNYTFVVKDGEIVPYRRQGSRQESSGEESEGEEEEAGDAETTGVSATEIPSAGGV